MSINPQLPVIPFDRFVITLNRRGSEFVWMRNDGQMVSPIFRTAQCAAAWANRGMPFLTDDEWLLEDAKLNLPQ